MKILTLNLHCFNEDNVPLNQRFIADAIKKENIDIIFLQEVAQSENLDIISNDIKGDNYGYKIQLLLKEAGLNYYLYYKTGNLAFNKYDEGLAILSKTEMFHMKHFFVSKKVEYSNWNTRVIINAKTKLNNKELSLTCAHLGWSDGDEVFEDQVDLLLDNLETKDINIIAGDFNVKAGSKEYNYVIDKGYTDLFYNGDKESYNTPTHLDDMDIHKGSSRIDFIMSNQEFKVLNRKILFKDNRVSDHFGVLLEIDL